MFNKKLTWTAVHVPVSLNVCSNVPNFEYPVCFVSDGDPMSLVKKSRLSGKNLAAYNILRPKYQFVFGKLQQLEGDLAKKLE